MARLRGTLMIGGLVAALVLAPRIEAADGRIVFSGTIVAATCTTGIGQAITPDAPRALSQGRCAPLAAAAGEGPSFRREVSDLQASANDPLLTYFAGYARGTGDARPRMVTQTYD